MMVRTLSVALALVVVLGLAVAWLTGAGGKQLTSAAHDEAAAEVLGDEELAARACDVLAQAQPDDWWAAHDAVLPLVGESFRVAVLLVSEHLGGGLIVRGDEELAARACDVLAQAQPDDWWAAHDAVLPLVGESFRVAVLLGSLPCPELVPPAR